MQADDASSQNPKDRLKALISSAGDLSKFQIAVICTLLVLIVLGAVFAYTRSRPRQISVKEPKNYSSGSRKRMLTVHVAGAVAKPGLYRLTEGSRVADALSMAGGATQDGILDDVNLASRIKDGQKVLVPRSNGDLTASGAPEQSVAGTLINVNTADEAELEKLPGVGPALAKSIVEYRRKNGPFSTVEELDNVEGIGPRKLELMKGQVTI
jgi:competence protein ComEA